LADVVVVVSIGKCVGDEIRRDHVTPAVDSNQGGVSEWLDHEPSVTGDSVRDQLKDAATDRFRLQTEHGSEFEDVANLLNRVRRAAD
jgi:hypothetical protein